MKRNELRRWGSERRWLAGMVAGLLLAFGCASDEEQIAQFSAEAEAYRAEGDYRSELVALKSALKLDPNNGELSERIANAYRALDDPTQAAFYFGEAYRLDPSRTRAALFQVGFLYDSDPDAAERLIEEVLEKEPGNPTAFMKRAELQLVRGEGEEALASALTAAELAPDSVAAHRTVGAVHRALVREQLLRHREAPDEMHQAAIDAFDRAVVLSADREALGAWYDRREQAHVYSSWAGHKQDAQAKFKEAHDLAKGVGDDGGTLAVLIDAESYANQTNDLVFLRWVLERRTELESNNVRVWQRLARRAAEAGDSPDEVWKRAIESQPAEIHFHVEYARDLADRERIADGLAYLDGLKPRLRNSPEAGVVRIELFLARADALEAQKMVEQLQRDHPDELLTRFAEARLHMARGRHEEAAVILRSLAADSERSDVLRMLAQAEARLGNREAALSAAERAISANPSASAIPHHLRILALAGAEDWTGMLRSIREMRRAGFPILQRHRILRVRALYETGRAEAARKVLETMLGQETVPPAAAMVFATYEMQNDPARAVQLLEDAREQAPKNRALMRALVAADVEANRPEKALERIQQFSEATGNPAPLPGVAAQVLFRLGRLEEAEVQARAAMEMGNRPLRAPDLLVAILTVQGKTAEAVELFEGYDAEGRLGVRGAWNLGRLYLEIGELEKARDQFEKAHAESPEMPEAVNDLAFVLAEIGTDLDRATQLAKDAKAARPDDHAVADTLGYVYYRKGLLEPALFELRSAVELAEVEGQQIADYHYHLGLVLKGQGRLEDAKASFDRALQIEPTHEGARAALAGNAGDAGGAG